MSAPLDLPPLLGSPAAAGRWCRRWAAAAERLQVLVLLAATETAAVEGISAAGATPASRRLTAAADAELLLLGPAAARPHALPPLPAGVSPALISHVVLQELGLRPLLVDLGCPVAPAVPHLRLAAPAAAGPARCLSGGVAMEPQRLEALLAVGARLLPPHSAAATTPLLLAECVPGGTSTAQALLTGLGIDCAGLVSGSLRQPVHGLKRSLVARGLAAAGLTPGAAEPLAICAAVGDPFQPLAAALVLAAAAAGRPLMLAGGSQMAAVLALALALAPPALRPRLVAGTALATTAWVAEERGSDLELLLRRIGERWAVEPLAFAAALRFPAGCHAALLDYERGYVKEGVGAGGLALHWQLTGRTPAALALACDRACRRLLAADPAAPTVR